MPFEFENAALNGIVIVHPKRFRDARGAFEECYHSRDFAENGIEPPFVQDNQSWSIQNTVRGLHYQQRPGAQGKLVRVVAGRILDVAVDIRQQSPTFGKHICFELDAEKGTMIYIPDGFAHGFSVLSAEAVVHYKTTSFYQPDLEQGIRWDDPDLGIDWKVDHALLSDKDKELPSLNEKDPASLL